MTQQPVNTAQRNQEVNLFIFTDYEKSTRIVFFPQAPGPARPGQQAGDALLEYQGPEGQLTFLGRAIDQQQSRLGLLITVMLESNALDTGQLDLTLMLPPVNLADQRKHDFETVAIKTRGLGFVVNRAGAELTYTVLTLNGIAECAILPV